MTFSVCRQSQCSKQSGCNRRAARPVYGPNGPYFSGNPYVNYRYLNPHVNYGNPYVNPYVNRR